MKEWSDARGRMEGDIQRKKEHVIEGNNFEQARGYVRSNWSTKNYNWQENPLEAESSEEEYGEEEYEGEGVLSDGGIVEIPEDEDEAEDGDEAVERLDEENRIAKEKAR